MAIVQQKNQITLALDRLLEQFKGKPNIEGVIKSYVQQSQDLEDSYFSLLNDRNIFTAIGVQLDLLGALVNEPRQGKLDEDYRLSILTRVGINNSEGTPNQVMALLKSLSQATKVKMWEHFPVGAVYYTNTSYEGSPDIEDTLQLISPATSGNVTVIFDPDETALTPAESALEEFLVVDDLGNLLIDDLGNLISAQVWVAADNGFLELAVLSEILPTSLDVDAGVGLESLSISADGITTEDLEVWSATAFETSESPYGVAPEASKSS